MRYNPQLDGLRTIAVGLVMTGHFIPSLAEYHPGGGNGVRLFFVLSGFLITGILLQVKKECRDQGLPRLWALRQFYIRRTLRIFPLYYLVLALCYTLDIGKTRDAFGWLVTYTSNWGMIHTGRSMGSVSHLWSLAVEEQFYLVWPWLILFLPWRSLPLLLGSLITFSLGCKIVGVWQGWSFNAVYISTFAALDALALGALLSFIHLNARTPRVFDRAALVMFLASVGTFTAVYVYKLQNPDYPLQLLHLDYVATTFASVSLIHWAARGVPWPLRRLLENGFMTFTGKISYGLYVYHLPVVGLIEKLYQEMGWHWAGAGWGWGGTRVTRILVVFGTTYLVCVVSWFAFERPINGTKRFFTYLDKAPRRK